MGSNINEINLNDLVFFFKLEMDDTSNTKIIGSTTDYCLGTECVLPNFRIIGNPGNYKLIIKLVTYGAYSSFDNSEIEIDIIISECNTTKYKYQEIEHKNLKSCYEAVCDPMCINGECVNNNVCDCKETHFKGKLCDEHYALERIKTIDYLIFIISIILILLSVILIIGIVIYRNNTTIKA
ncbi:hypothetical protein PIROE2DRAFT_9583, partial [Piromyces sp. E2]